jgi:hypothetical protein
LSSSQFENREADWLDDPADWLAPADRVIK